MSRLWAEDNDNEMAYEKGYDDGYADGFSEGLEEGKKELINRDVEVEPLSFDGACPNCATKLKTFSEAIDKADEMVDIAEYCPNCNYGREM